MEFHRGRLIDHVHLRVSNLEVSKCFYKAVFAALGFPDVVQLGPGFFYADELFSHPGYYAAFALDPDGNNIEAVFHGPSDRTASSVVITPR